MRRSENRSSSSWSALVIACALAAGPYGACAEHAPEHRDQNARHTGYPRAKHYIVRRDHPIVVPPSRLRHYRDVVILRPYGRWYTGYGRYHTDADAFKWLALTAITLKILDNLNEAEERAHEEAQIRATTAPIGETIIWKEGGASGSVTPTREGTSTAGRYCREFQQKVTIGGHTEEAYGTACLQPDGSWEVVSTGQ
jgi:hypothetical protein